MLLVSSILGLLFASAWASGTEAALFAVPISKINAMTDNNRKVRALTALKASKESMEQSIMAIVVVNNIANIFGSIWIGMLAEDLFGPKTYGPFPVVGIISAALTLTVICYAEIVPKTFGERYSEEVSLMMAPLVLLFSKILFPLIWVVQLLTDPVTKRIGSGEAVTSEEEIKALAEMGRMADIIEDDEADIIKRVFALNDMTAWDIMIPASKVDSLEGDKTLSEIREDVFALTHTRLPVYEGNMGNILGIANQRDILKALANDQDELLVRELAHPAAFIPSNTTAAELLTFYQEKKQHLAVVVDAFGTMLGVVALEDVLEELVGDIIDETDIEIREVQRIGPEKCLVKPEAPCIEINELLGSNLPDRRIAEVILEELGKIPQAGARFQSYGVEVVIQSATPRAIDEILIRKLTEEEDLEVQETESIAGK